MAGEWDRFVDEGKNATFLFRRSYMDYHADRFEDHSLAVRKDGRLVALLPANRSGASALCSHQGLTYGGVVLRRDASLMSVLQIVHALLAHLRDTGFETLVYKAFPRFYNTLPADELDYALFMLEARLIRRDCALVVAAADRLALRRGKKSKINQGRRAGLTVVEEGSFDPFWLHVLQPRLQSRYGVKPVHSVEEITLLAQRHPQQIRQFSAYQGETIVAGATIYETPSVAHMQYGAATEEGDRCSALDLLFGWLVTERYRDKPFFDFGICNEQQGRWLNTGLLQSKEGFGARSASHDFYEIDTRACTKLLPLLQAGAASAADPAGD